MSCMVRNSGRIYGLAVVALLLIVLVACDGESPEPLAIPTSTLIPAQETPNVLRLAIPGPNANEQTRLVGLDPGLVMDSQMGTIINLLFEPICCN